MVPKPLTDENGLLSGIQISDIPASFASIDQDLFKRALLKFSGIQKIKVQEHSQVFLMRCFIPDPLANLCIFCAGLNSSFRHTEVGLSHMQECIFFLYFFIFLSLHTPLLLHLTI
jgi:hypothetical protein